MSDALMLSGLDAGYNQSRVVRHLDLVVGEGEVVALFGPNGAGKTTTLLTVSGLLPPIGGDIAMFGESIDGWSPTKRVRAGLGHVPEDRSLFPQLSVMDNLTLASPSRRTDLSEVLDGFPALVKIEKRKAGLLSGGEQQMLAIARALAGNPKVLMVDELSMGLAPLISAGLVELLHRLAVSRGISVLLVEQHVRLALRHVDRAYVLAHGEVVAQGTRDELLANSSLLDSSYLGGDSQ